jgi:hypothetical protein
VNCERIPPTSKSDYDGLGSEIGSFYGHTHQIILRSGYREIWSNGIVLKRNFVVDGEGAKVTYERVGRFWIEWPLVRDEGDPRAGNVASMILNRTKEHIVRIE